MKNTFMRSRDLNPFVISGCAITFLTFTFFAPDGDGALRLAQVPVSETGEFEKSKLKGKQKLKLKAKFAGKASKMGEAGATMKAAGGKACPPGQVYLGARRKGGCS